MKRKKLKQKTERKRKNEKQKRNEKTGKKKKKINKKESTKKNKENKNEEEKRKLKELLLFFLRNRKSKEKKRKWGDFKCSDHETSLNDVHAAGYI